MIAPIRASDLNIVNVVFETAMIDHLESGVERGFDAVSPAQLVRQ